jgi:benzoylformate decarboxylase
VTTAGESAQAAATADSAANAMLQTLEAWGVDRVFICPGSTEAAFLDASLSHPGVELVLTTHEAITVSAADAYARLSGRPAVAYVHTHVGLTNGLAHLYCAQLERSPVVVITGLKATGLQGPVAGFLTTPDTAGLARPFVKWAHASGSTATIPGDLDHALRVATTVPCGPTFLGIAQDLFDAPGPVTLADGPGRPSGRVRPEPAAVEAVADRLAAARRPLLVAGSEVFRAGALTALDALAELLGAPVVLEDRRSIDRAATAEVGAYAGVFDARSDVALEADLIFLAGARAPIRFEQSAPPSLPPGTPVIHLCEDAHELTRGPAGSLPVLGDSELALADVRVALAAVLDGPAEEAVRFRAFATDAYSERVERLRAEAEQQAGAQPIRVPALMHRLCRALEPGTHVVDDSVTSKSALIDHALVPDAGLRYLTTGGGSLGWAMGAALGVALARPGERIVAVVGDGVFQFGIPALWTAVDQRLEITFVVVNNRGYAAVKAALVRFDGEAAARERYPTTSLAGPDLAAVARGFGATAARVERLEQLPDALAQASAAGGPAVVEVLTDPSDMGPLR